MEFRDFRREIVLFNEIYITYRNSICLIVSKNLDLNNLCDDILNGYPKHIKIIYFHIFFRTAT